MTWSGRHGEVDSGLRDQTAAHAYPPCEEVYLERCRREIAEHLPYFLMPMGYEE